MGRGDAGDGPAAVPSVVKTDRLLLRCWRADDALRLLPVLEANVSRLVGWIPATVASPAPLAELAERLTNFAQAFASNEQWRYGLFSPDETSVLGEVSLFPRTTAERTALAAADRVEIGYWLSAEATGRGLATEASKAMLRVAAALPGIEQVEIRCDVRNLRSAAVPRRLGFHLADTLRGEVELQIWALSLGE